MKFHFSLCPLTRLQGGLAGQLPVTYFDDAEIEKGTFHLACSLEVPKIKVGFLNEQV